MIAMRGQLRFHHELAPYTERVGGLLGTAMNLGLHEAMYKLAGAAARWWLQHQNTPPPPGEVSTLSHPEFAQLRALTEEGTANILVGHIKLRSRTAHPRRPGAPASAKRPQDWAENQGLPHGAEQTPGESSIISGRMLKILSYSVSRYLFNCIRGFPLVLMGMFLWRPGIRGDPTCSPRGFVCVSLRFSPVGRR